MHAVIADCPQDFYSNYDLLPDLIRPNFILVFNIGFKRHYYCFSA